MEENKEKKALEEKHIRFERMFLSPDCEWLIFGFFELKKIEGSVHWYSVTWYCKDDPKIIEDYKDYFHSLSLRLGWEITDDNCGVIEDINYSLNPSEFEKFDCTETVGEMDRKNRLPRGECDAMQFEAIYGVPRRLDDELF